MVITETADKWIGLRVARWRDIAGMTQQQLADTLGITREYISQIENGHKAVAKRSLLIGLAGALGVSVPDLIAQPYEPTSRADMLAYSIAASVRVALDGDTDRVERRTPGELALLARQVVDARMACDNATLLTLLPQVISEARAAANGPDEQLQVAGLDALVKACVYGSYVLKTAGNTDLSMRMAERARLAAGKLGNPIHIAAGQMALAQSLMAGGIRERAFAVAVAGTELVQDHLADSDALAWFGTLHMQAALCSASLGQPDAADAHMNEASDAADRIRGEHSWGMEFTPTNVQIWRLGVALENGEPERAPELAQQIDQAKVRSPQRMARLHMDTGRGLYAAGRRNEAIQAFLQADTAAPSEVRHRSSVREIVGEMVRTARREYGSPQLRDLAVRCGVDPVREV